MTKNIGPTLLLPLIFFLPVPVDAAELPNYDTDSYCAYLGEVAGGSYD